MKELEVAYVLSIGNQDLRYGFVGSDVFVIGVRGLFICIGDLELDFDRESGEVDWL